MTYIATLLLVLFILRVVLNPLLQYILVPIVKLIRDFIVFLGRKIRLRMLYMFTPTTTQEIADIGNTLDEVLNSVVWHTEEKRQIKSILLTNAVKKFKNTKFGLRHNIAEIVEIYGNPGIGKTELVKNLCRTLCKWKNPFVVTSAMIDQKSKESVLDQLLYLDKKKEVYRFLLLYPHSPSWICYF